MQPFSKEGRGFELIVVIEASQYGLPFLNCLLAISRLQLSEFVHPPNVVTFEGECARERHLLNVMVPARFSAPLACLIRRGECVPCMRVGYESCFCSDGAEIPKLVFDGCSEGMHWKME